jgi:hypothetical protein
MSSELNQLPYFAYTTFTICPPIASLASVSTTLKCSSPYLAFFHQPHCTSAFIQLCNVPQTCIPFHDIIVHLPFLWSERFSLPFSAGYTPYLLFKSPLSHPLISQTCTPFPRLHCFLLIFLL